MRQKRRLLVSAARYRHCHKGMLAAMYYPIFLEDNSDSLQWGMVDAHALGVLSSWLSGRLVVQHDIQVFQCPATQVKNSLRCSPRARVKFC